MKHVNHHEPQVKHCETYEHLPFDAISVLDAATSVLSMAISLLDVAMLVLCMVISTPWVEFLAIFAIAELI